MTTWILMYIVYDKDGLIRAAFRLYESAREYAQVNALTMILAREVKID